MGFVLGVESSIGCVPDQVRVQALIVTSTSLDDRKFEIGSVPIKEVDHPAFFVAGSKAPPAIGRIYRVELRRAVYNFCLWIKDIVKHEHGGRGVGNSGEARHVGIGEVHGGGAFLQIDIHRIAKKTVTASARHAI